MPSGEVQKMKKEVERESEEWHRSGEATLIFSLVFTVKDFVKGATVAIILMRDARICTDALFLTINQFIIII